MLKTLLSLRGNSLALKSHIGNFSVKGQDVLQENKTKKKPNKSKLAKLQLTSNKWPTSTDVDRVLLSSLSGVIQKNPLTFSLELLFLLASLKCFINHLYTNAAQLYGMERAFVKWSMTGNGSMFLWWIPEKELVSLIPSFICLILVSSWSGSQWGPFTHTVGGKQIRNKLQLRENGWTLAERFFPTSCPVLTGSWWWRVVEMHQSLYCSSSVRSSWEWRHPPPMTHLH